MPAATSAKRVSLKPPKIRRWKHGLQFTGEPFFDCPACGERHLQTVCPEHCRHCDVEGNPSQRGGQFIRETEADAQNRLDGMSTIERGRAHLNGTGAATLAAGREKNGRAKAHEAPPPAADAPASAPGLADAVMIPLRDIVPNPKNPRQVFDEEKLKAFAHGIEHVGILSPLLVRRSIVAAPRGPGEKELEDLGLLSQKPGEKKFEILDGERRYRAARLAKLHEVPCRVLDITDEEAAEVMVRGNLDREDLNPIERARSYQLALDTCGWTQEQLAKRFDTSQETISNTLRLLKLPPAWQDRLIQGVISPTHARELLPWADLPAIPERIEKEAKERGSGWGSAKEFREDMLEVLNDLSKPIAFESYEYGSGCKFRPTKEQLAQLDVREVPRRWGPGKQKRAFNVKLWNELQSAAKKRKREKQPPKGKKQESSKDYHARYEREQRERNFGATVLVERCNYQGAQIAAALDPEKHGDLVERTLLSLVAAGETNEIHEALAEALADGKKRRSHVGIAVALRAVVKLKSDALGDLLFSAMKTALGKPAEGWWHPAFDLPLLDWLAKSLKIEVLAGWEPSLEFLGRFPEARLAALVDQFPKENYEAAGGAVKATSATLLANWPPGLIPRELYEVDEKGNVPKAGAKRAKKKARSK